MDEFRSHTVTIDGQKFYAQEPKADIPYPKRRKVEIKIEDGPSKWVYKGIDLRVFTFKTFIPGSVSTTRDTLARLCSKVCQFSSPYIGNFTAMVEYKIDYQNATPRMTYVNFEIQEVK